MSPYVADWRIHWYNTNNNIDVIDDDGAPNTGLAVEFLATEYDCDMVLQLTGQGTTRASWIETLPISVSASPNPQTVFVPFSQFTESRYTWPFNLSAVAGVGLSVYGAEDGDYALDELRVDVPEPATMTLLAFGGLLLMRRRRK